MCNAIMPQCQKVLLTRTVQNAVVPYTLVMALAQLKHVAQYTKGIE